MFLTLKIKLVQIDFRYHTGDLFLFAPNHATEELLDTNLVLLLKQRLKVFLGFFLKESRRHILFVIGV